MWVRIVAIMRACTKSRHCVESGWTISGDEIILPQADAAAKTLAAHPDFKHSDVAVAQQGPMFDALGLLYARAKEY